VEKKWCVEESTHPISGGKNKEGNKKKKIAATSERGCSTYLGDQQKSGETSVDPRWGNTESDESKEKKWVRVN